MPILFYFLLQVCEIAVIFHLFYTYFLPFVPRTIKIKYCYKNSNKLLWVAAISAGRSLEGQQTLFLGLVNTPDMIKNRSYFVAVEKP